ncbi:hypothetical protein CSH63_04185 [Micromonospora tulbaghiae]|uniref:Integrase catalytic domain-containing protein n=1 Tax=Micromonospora tulbaghiae TaxID=479978 RepID=A0A386WE56_9ACTN|nr:IS3 family transposase [Micromonospora tulbaghiae]AYF26676.1 hypothetical protein CSH63_04185 [Micromonospora tulbaghiae]
MRFVDAHRGRFGGVEPICRVLRQHGLQITPSGYWAAKKRPPSVRQRRDAQLTELVRGIHAANYGVYGARKIWHELHRQGHPVARCTVERLMRDCGLTGVVRGKKIRTTMAEPGHERAADLLNRDFTARRPNRTWVADFTHVATWSGVVYVAFVVDVYSRAIVGWSAATNKRTPLVLAALDMGLWRRDRAGQPVCAGLVHHSDAGSQGEFKWSSQHLDQGVWHGKTCRLGNGGDRPPGDAFAGSAGGERTSGDAAAVLAADR